MSRNSRSSTRRNSRSSDSQTRQERKQKSQLKGKVLNFKNLFYGILALSLVTGIYAFHYFQGIDRLKESTIVYLEKAALKNGIRLENIVVEGRHNTSTQEISKALAVRKGTNLFSLDVHTLKDRLADLPWVRSAIVQRRFPETLYIRLRERTPVALWHDKGKTHLIDDQGREIEKASPVKHQKLLTVSGEDAPKHAPKIVTKLRPFPGLIKRLRGAVLNGGRQWDLLVGEGLRIKLPESGLEEALAYVNTLVETGHLDNPKIRSIDVRLEDRTFFYLDPEEAKKHQVSFQQKKGRGAPKR